MNNKEEIEECEREAASDCEHEFDWEEGYTCLHCGKQGHIATDDMIEACNPDSPFAVAAWIREQE
jgi:hypothetical protein